MGKKLTKNLLEDHQVEIYNICIAQGMERSTAVFFALVYFPYMMSKKMAEGEEWKGYTQRQFADKANISPPAAKVHLKRLIDMGLVTRERYREYYIEPRWRTVLYQYRRNQLAQRYRDAQYA